MKGSVRHRWRRWSHWVANPTSPQLSTQPSPGSPPLQTGPLDHFYRKHFKIWSEFHIKSDATYLAPASMDIKDSRTSTIDLKNQSYLQTSATSRSSRHTSRPVLHIKMIRRIWEDCRVVLYENEYIYLEQHDRIQLTNIDPLLQAGYPNLYQHIHLHQQATDAINFKITSTLFLTANEQIEDNWKEEFLRERLYLVAILVKVDEPRTRNILRPHRRDRELHRRLRNCRKKTSLLIFSPLQARRLASLRCLVKERLCQLMLQGSHGFLLCYHWLCHLSSQEDCMWSPHMVRHKVERQWTSVAQLNKGKLGALTRNATSSVWPACTSQARQFRFVRTLRAVCSSSCRYSSDKGPVIYSHPGSAALTLCFLASVRRTGAFKP